MQCQLSQDTLIQCFFLSASAAVLLLDLLVSKCIEVQQTATILSISDVDFELTAVDVSKANFDL